MGQRGYERERDVRGLAGGEAYGQLGHGHGAHQSHPAHRPQHLHSNTHRDLQQIPPHPAAGPSSSIRNGTVPMEEGRRERKRKEPPKAGKDLGDRRDDGRHFAESVSNLHNTAHLLSTRPDLSPVFRLRLYPLTLERSALLAQYEVEERYSIECAQVAYDEERERVEDEWRRGRERVRERLLEGIEERRRRAREEKEGDGTAGDAILDIHSRPPTRKLRNKIGTSPPPTPHVGPSGGVHPLSNTTFSVSANANGTLSSNLPITTGPFPNPHSLSVDDLPSPFPLPLTSTQPASSNGANGVANGLGAGAGSAMPNGGRRRVKGGGAHQGQAIGGLGKSLMVFNVVKDNDLDSDMLDIRKGTGKRRRVAANATMAKTGGL
ncbi:hypothetical protein HYPSUDRAFT_37122 [Hypholoma sublateritium FD-334 SS-4]|uniref:Uncharacterized protein n=1 Tax=Hypholoma sublateritium (strain FD-334 SS-4) TaxID=945553 RepID=A0A0D2PAW0_HYPSF|nr:hypothetical protein HYPSUDRAFT_37122 [Hypholoma sublateritium FD-334 SS-4]